MSTKNLSGGGGGIPESESMNLIIRFWVSENRESGRSFPSLKIVKVSNNLKILYKCTLYSMTPVHNKRMINALLLKGQCHENFFLN